MRSYSSAAIAHLSGDTTTLGTCWSVIQTNHQPEITNISQAASALVTTFLPHNKSVGDPIFIANVNGMTQINDTVYQITSVVSSTIVETNASTTTYSAYTSGGDMRTVLGYTDHDEDIIIGNITYESQSGILGTKVDVRQNGGVSNMDIQSLLGTGATLSADIEAGLYDDAVLSVFVVNYETPSAFSISIIDGVIGEIKISDTEFEVEVRDFIDFLQRPAGQYYSKTCRANLGDARCGVDVTAYASTMSVASVATNTSFVVSAIVSAPNYQYGTLTWLTGANQGYKVEIAAAASTTFTLLRRMPNTITVGDVFSVHKGCDRVFATCRDIFNNVNNFRGEPHVPMQNEVSKYGSNT